jgi:hypothetical protein
MSPNHSPRQVDVQARAAIDEALDVAKRIGDADERERVLLGVVYPLSLVDADRALALARSSRVGEGYPQDAILAVAVRMARANPDRAVSIADGIEGGGYRVFALSQVAQALAITDPSRSRLLAVRALKLARAVAGKFDRDLALLNAALAFARIDPATAVKVAKSIGNPGSRAGALESVTEVILRTDPQKALQIAMSIEDNFYRAIALMEVSRALSRTQPSRSKALVERVLEDAPGIKDRYLREGILGQVATELVRTDPARATEVASRIQKPEDRATILCELAAALAKERPAESRQLIEDAVAAARGIGDEYYRDVAYSHIAGALASVYPERALAVWGMIHTPSERDAPLARIFRNLQRVDPTGAAAKAEQLKDAHARAVALIAITEQLAWTDADRALELARSVADEPSRVEALCYVAAVILSPQDMREAD